MRAALAVVLSLLPACSGPKDAFDCTASASCRLGATIGTCESTGFCSFPDPSCPMGSRYGEAAGGGLAGQCVGQTGSDGGSGSDGSTTATDPRPLGAWDMTAAVPAPRYTHATAQNGNYVYVIGGIAGSTGHADVWVATTNPTAALPSASVALWTQTTSLPANRWTFGAAYSAGFLYTFGGRTDANGDTADVLVAPVNADGTVGAWTATTSLPQSIKCEAVVASGTDVYVIGGKHAGTATAVVLHAKMSNGAITPWQLAATLDVTLFDSASVVAGGYLYVLGGCAGGNNVCSQLLDVVEVAKINADGSLGAFTRTAALPMGRSHHTAAASPAGDIYIAGGTYGAHLADALTVDVIAAHPRADGTIAAWRTMTALPAGQRRATSAVVGNYLLVIQTRTLAAAIQ